MSNSSDNFNFGDLKVVKVVSACIELKRTLRNFIPSSKWMEMSVGKRGMVVVKMNEIMGREWKEQLSSEHRFDLFINALAYGVPLSEKPTKKQEDLTPRRIQDYEWFEPAPPLRPKGATTNEYSVLLHLHSTVLESSELSTRKAVLRGIALILEMIEDRSRDLLPLAPAPDQ